MNQLKKETESFSRVAREGFNSEIGTDGGIAILDPKLIEAALAREMAQFESKSDRSKVHQITMCIGYNTWMHFQMTTIPCLGDEIALFHQGGREQVYTVAKIRHNAYASSQEREISRKSTVVVWLELVKNPARIGSVSKWSN